jgi:hypothetical protein
MTPEQRRLFELLPKLFVGGTAGYYVWKFVTAPKEVEVEDSGPIKIDKNVLKVGVDARFWKQFKYIMKICIPSWKSRTVGLISLHTIFLVLRTYLTVIVARIDGRLVRDLVIIIDLGERKWKVVYENTRCVYGDGFARNVYK